MCRVARWYMPTVLNEYGANPKKRWIRLAIRVLFKLTEMIFFSEDSSHGLKWDPLYVWRRPSRVNVAEICLMTMCSRLLVCNIPLNTFTGMSFNKTMLLVINSKLNPKAPQTSTCFPGQQGHLSSLLPNISEMPFKDIFDPLTPLQKSSWALGDCSGFIDRYAAQRFQCFVEFIPRRITTIFRAKGAIRY